MTPLDLLDALKAYVENEIKDLVLPTRVDRNSGETPERPAEVHELALPDKKAETERIPYVLLKFLTGMDDQKPGEPLESDCKIRIVAAVYSENKAEGEKHLLNLLTRIRLAFLRDGSIADRYFLKPPLEMIVYQDNKPPYFLGEMVMGWTLPPVYLEPPFAAGYNGNTPTVESEVENKW